MKKFFLVLITLSVLPFSMLRSQNEGPIIAGLAVVAGIVGVAGYQYWSKQQNPSVSTTATSTQQVEDKKHQNSADGNVPGKDSSDKKDSDKKTEKHNDSALFASIKKNSDDRIDGVLNKKPSPKESPIFEKPVPSDHNNTLNQTITTKPIEIIIHKEPSFMEKLLAYEADYKELHDENRDCFEN